MNNRIAIITARGGSKRIPRKNVRDFMGRPMLSYAINAAKASNVFQEIMVSTEDEEIAAIAASFGAEVPFLRSEETASDHATTFDVVNEVISKYSEIGRNFEELCCIYPCVPFLRPQTLKVASEMMSIADGVIPVCRYPVPIEWAMKMEEGVLVPIDREAQLIRSQDLIPKYYDAGMFYFVKTDVLLAERTVIPARANGLVMSEEECQDIDTPEDWRAAEMKFRLLNNQM